MHQAPQSFPLGVERVLHAAAADPATRQALLRDRPGALAGLDLDLTDTERAMLLAIPDDQLTAAINGLDISPANVKRRTLLAAVATTSATLATWQMASGCMTGTRPDDEVRKDGGPGDGGAMEAGPDSGPTPDSSPGPDSGPTPDSGPSPDSGPTPDTAGAPVPDSGPMPDAGSAD